jgi:two-component system cell cycle response regulator DivK
MDTWSLLTLGSEEHPFSSNPLRWSHHRPQLGIESATEANSLQSAAVPLARILLLEDNATSRQLMSDYLEYYGYTVLGLAQGSLLFDAVEQFCPQIILLDLKLPDMDGFALLQQFRQRAEWQRIPIIIVSAFAFQADQQRALNLGAQRYFVKPVNLSQLRNAIRDELSLVIVSHP